jgi:ribosomal protein S18 acetylase RimI-like enzyme
MYEYLEDLTDVEQQHLAGFFVGWPAAPTPAQHLAVLRGSHKAVLARLPDSPRVVGFVHMISDGVLTAFIPWLEVLPEHQGRGVGTTLMRRVLDGTDHLYSIDLLCDAPLQSYYEGLGMTRVPGMAMRHPGALRSPVSRGLPG